MGQNATIFMKGGFGNQLFQIAFAHYLKLNNYKVNINLDFFVDDGYSTPRNLIFSENFFGLKKQTYFAQKKFWLLYRLNHSQNFPFFYNRIKEYTFINDYMMIDKNVCREMLPDINDLLDFCNQNLSEDCLLADYEMYGNFATWAHPDMYETGHTKTQLNGKYVQNPWAREEIQDLATQNHGSDLDLFTIHSWT